MSLLGPCQFTGIGLQGRVPAQVRVTKGRVRDGGGLIQARWALRTLAAEDMAGWAFIVEGQMLLQLRLEFLLQAYVHAALLSGVPSPPCPACPNPFHVPKLNQECFAQVASLLWSRAKPQPAPAAVGSP